MATFLFVRGMDPVELAPEELFNKVRHRANRAAKLVIDYENGNLDGETKGQKFEPSHLLTFKTVDEDGNVGRISILPEHYIGVGSDEEKDVGGGAEDEDDEE